MVDHQGTGRSNHRAFRESNGSGDGQQVLATSRIPPKNQRYFQGGAGARDTISA
jgi:hypothetical protein